MYTSICIYLSKKIKITNQNSGGFMLTVKEIVSHLKNKKLDVIEDMMGTATPLPVATSEEIADFEKRLGLILPDSYKEYLTTYSNGEMYLLGIEPMCGVHIGETLCSSFKLLYCVNTEEEIEHIEETGLTKEWTKEEIEKRKAYLRKEWHKEAYIIPEKRYVHLKYLVPVTYGDYYEISNDHWAFICDKEYENHDYPMGFVSQCTGNIICVVKNFEEWLNLFWEFNKDRTKEYLPVIHGLIPDWEEREELLEYRVEE